VKVKLVVPREQASRDVPAWMQKAEGPSLQGRPAHGCWQYLCVHQGRVKPSLSRPPAALRSAFCPLGPIVWRGLQRGDGPPHRDRLGPSACLGQCARPQLAGVRPRAYFL